MKLKFQRKEQKELGLLHCYSHFFLPAAGPKAFVSSGFEKLLLEELHSRVMEEEEEEKRYAAEKTLKTWHFVAGSTGALRALALITSSISSQDHTALLKDQFCNNMYYKHGMTGEDLHPMMVQAFEIAAPIKLLPQALGHSRLRVAIMVCRIRYFTHLPSILLRLFFVLLWTLNLFSHKLLSLFVERLCFYSGPSPPKDLITDTPLLFYPLTEENTHQILHATTCIPFISRPCTYISGLGRGIYLDGGVTDYYLNTGLDSSDDEIHGLLLADIEPSNKRIPRSALDALNPFFTLGAGYQRDKRFSKICMIRPSFRFVEALPAATLPSVNDWFNADFIREPAKRQESWNHAFELSRREWPKAFIANLSPNE